MVFSSAPTYASVVVLDRGLEDRRSVGGRGTPAEQFLDALATGRPVGRLTLGVVQQLPDSSRQLSDVARLHQIGTQAINSAVGREKPSYSDGTQATSAEPIRATRSSSETPLTKWTESAMPSESSKRSVRPPGFGLVTRTSSTSRSVRSFA